jgi:hypothetical protein
MKGIKHLALAIVAGACFAGAASHAQAQVALGIESVPNCAHGLYGYPPYACAPNGYYGPEWFDGSRFDGAGPWGHRHEAMGGHEANHVGGEHRFGGGGGGEHGGGGHEGGGHR